MLKNPYGKNWEVSSFYIIYCVAAHTKNTIYCDIPVCNSLKIPRCKNRTGSNPVSGTKALLQWECFFHIINLTARVVFYLNRLAEKYKIQNFCIIKNQIISF